MQPTTEQLLSDFFNYLKNINAINASVILKPYSCASDFMERFQIPKSTLTEHTVRGITDEDMKGYALQHEHDGPDFIEIDSNEPKTYQAICPTTQKPCENDLLCNTTCHLTQMQPLVLNVCIDSVPTGQYMFSEETVKSICKMFVPENSIINNLQEVIDSFKASQFQHPVPDEAGEGKGWISAEDMPQDAEPVLVYSANAKQGCKMTVGMAVKELRGFYTDDDELSNVTHWQPLPAPPNVKQ